ncbi:MAG: ABC transporter ATP-binding protein [Erysipelotrichaceae bacterium]|nr:ABC transporter ATP-binding protein [Erysipelotrichaceae bacterium]
MFRLLKKYTKDGWWAALLGPIFTVMEVFVDARIPLTMSRIIDKGIYEMGGDMNYIWKQGVLMVMLALLGAFFGACSGLFSSIASTGFIRNIRYAMFSKIQEYSFENIEKFPVPTVVMRMTTDMRMLRMAYVSIVRMLIRAPFNLLMSAYFVFTLNSSLAMIFAIALPILGVGLIYIHSKAHPRFRQMMHKFDALDSDLEENIDGIRVVKTFVREDYENKKFDESSNAVMDAQRFAEKIVIMNRPFFEMVMYSCMIAIAWFGGKDVIAGKMTTGNFMAYLSYIRLILFSLLMISNVYLQIVMAQASVDRANEILDEEPKVTDHDADPDLMVEDGSIEFRNVSFKYSDDAKKDVLSNIDLKIRSGEVIGILGPTGSSKTTLVQLIPRLYDVRQGEVIVGGHNVKEYKLKNLRDAVAMVLQKNTLFSGTIEENLKWGDPNATHEQVVEACKYAQADDFIQNMPKKYDTDLGQGGVNVSGGQKQRLCIARALLKHPKIIILDDSTSAVDTDTDHRIQLALKEKLGGMTTIIIAQRVASVKEADHILMMNEGTIQDIGTHDELMKKNEVYRDLYNTQMEGALE